MSGLRILHVIAAVAPRYGGPTDAVIGTCRALRARGDATLIATTDADGRTGRLDVAAGEPAQVYRGVPVVFFRRRFGESFKWSPALGRWLSARVSQFDLVDIHGVFSHASLAAGRACRRAGVPYVVRPHGMLDPWSLSQHRLQKQAWLAAAGARLLTRASAIQYTTAEEQRLAEAAVSGLPSGAVVPLGIDDDLFERSSAGASPARPYLLALCRLDPKKRLDVLIEAFHRIARDPAFVDWRLVIAGDGSPAQVRELRRLAAIGAGQRRIVFTGWVSGVEKASLLRDAALFAAPSFQENFGLSLMEAMASGVPVVLAERLDLASEVEAAGAGWRWTSGTDLAVLLEVAMRDGAERARRGEAAARFAQRSRWHTAAGHVSALYERVLAAGGRDPSMLRAAAHV